MRIGIVVNPDAGLGGRLGFKGSDGLASQAREAGAEDRAGPRMYQSLSRLHKQFTIRPISKSLELFVWNGSMGLDWIPEFNDTYWSVNAFGDANEFTTAEDTRKAVSVLIEEGIDLLLYGGGDGTTRDIVEELKSSGVSDLPIVGVPSGVKMHSGCFAATPAAAAEVVLAWMQGELLISSTEVMDLDEELYRQGKWKIRMFGEAMTPASPRWMQGAKQQIEAGSEQESIEALALHVKQLSENNTELIVIWGSGGTLRTMAEINGFEPTLLGIDATRGKKMIGKDLNEEQLLDLLIDHTGERLLLLSPMGGQGFLIGRGNLQLSPSVLRVIGLDNILGIVTPAKLLGLEKLRIDSGDDGLDAEFKERRYIKLLQGYRTTRIMRVSDDD